MKSILRARGDLRPKFQQESWLLSFAPLSGSLLGTGLLSLCPLGEWRGPVACPGPQPTRGRHGAPAGATHELRGAMGGSLPSSCSVCFITQGVLTGWPTAGGLRYCLATVWGRASMAVAAASCNKVLIGSSWRRSFQDLTIATRVLKNPEICPNRRTFLAVSLRMPQPPLHGISFRAASPEVALGTSSLCGRGKASKAGGIPGAPTWKVAGR